MWVFSFKEVSKKILSIELSYWWYSDWLFIPNLILLVSRTIYIDEEYEEEVIIKKSTNNIKSNPSTQGSQKSQNSKKGASDVGQKTLAYFINSIT